MQIPSEEFMTGYVLESGYDLDAQRIEAARQAGTLKASGQTKSGNWLYYGADVTDWIRAGQPAKKQAAATGADAAGGKAVPKRGPMAELQALADANAARMIAAGKKPAAAHAEGLRQAIKADPGLHKLALMEANIDRPQTHGRILAMDRAAAAR